MKKTSLKSFLNEIEEDDNVEEGVLKQNNTLTHFFQSETSNT